MASPPGLGVGEELLSPILRTSLLEAYSRPVDLCHEASR